MAAESVALKLLMSYRRRSTLNCSKEAGERNPQAIGQRLDAAQTHIARPAFHIRNVSAMKPGPIGKEFLAHPKLNPQLFDGLPELSID